MLKIGVTITDISPKLGVQLAGYPHCLRPNEGVHDPLYVSCMFIDNGVKKVAIVAGDIFWYSKEFVRTLRSRFDFDIITACTHTHSAPWIGKRHEFEYNEGVRTDEEYEQFMLDSIIRIVKEASENTFEGEIGTYVGHCGAEQGVGGNRREKGGVADPSVNLIVARDADKKIRGILLNYSLHPTYLHADNCLVSADYPGYIRRYLSFACPDAIFMFAQGTSGNQSSRYHRVGQNFEEACRAGTTLGVAIYNCLDKIEYVSDMEIVVDSIEIELPQKEWPDEKEAYEKMVKFQKRFESLKDADYITYRNAELDMFGAEDMYGLLMEAKNGYVDPNLPCEVQTVVLGDTAIVGLQGEHFVEYGLAIKAGSPYKKTYVFCLSGGSLPGYVYTPDAVNDGGYEVGNSTFTPDAGAVIVNTALDLLNK
ncbi:MAG: hypothetical protein IJ386_08425 [Clostridia bacterium]|nr:hypothetical protein [Clostridia bacterium]